MTKWILTRSKSRMMISKHSSKNTQMKKKVKSIAIKSIKTFRLLKVPKASRKKCFLIFRKKMKLKIRSNCRLEMTIKRILRELSRNGKGAAYAVSSNFYH